MKNVKVYAILISQLILLTSLLLITPLTKGDVRLSTQPAEKSSQLHSTNHSNTEYNQALLSDEKRPSQPRRHITQERPQTSWTVAFDNDILVPGKRDQDYTYGMNITFSGAQAQNNILSLHRPLTWFNQNIGIHSLASDNIRAHSNEFGLFGFTPEDISYKQANANDRPYASLVYLSSRQTQLHNNQNTAWHSTLTVGVLGLNIVGHLQNEVHSITDSQQAHGWNNQISDGGELTARYTVARQQLLQTHSTDWEIKTTRQLSVGYLTEANWSVNIRSGHINTSWNSFNPELTSYGEHSTSSTESKSAPEHYFWAGMSVKARVYNAFLQGQFRHSNVSYQSDEINHALLEAWVGYTWAFRNGYRISYVLRGHTSEIRSGDGDRNLLWGGLLLAKTFN